MILISIYIYTKICIIFGYTHIRVHIFIYIYTYMYFLVVYVMYIFVYVYIMFIFIYTYTQHVSAIWLKLQVWFGFLQPRAEVDVRAASGAAAPRVGDPQVPIGAGGALPMITGGCKPL